jgi:citrate lyase subunit beta/citryl-CoA lyase
MKTVLCVPGHDERKVERCREYGADLILFDLEDSVPEDKKDRAREIVKAHITRADAVRINLNQVDDLTMIVETRVLPHSIWVPKETYYPIWVPKETYYPRPSDYRSYALNVLAKQYRIVPIVETPELLRWFSTPRLHDTIGDVYAGLAFGAADFASYMNVDDWEGNRSPQVAYARQQVALAAKALGVPAYDSPFLNLKPGSFLEFQKDIYEAHQLGYDWKGCVHPAQIDVVKNDTWMPIFRDRQLVDRYERERGEDAVAVIDGRLVAPPMIRAARRRLEESSK